jgi:predicted peptidase
MARILAFAFRAEFGAGLLALTLAACGSGTVSGAGDDLGDDDGAPLVDADPGAPDGGGGSPDAFVALPDAGPPSARQVKRPVGTTDSTAGYLEYLPPGYPGGGGWPIMIFYHGIGENGDGSEAQLDRVAANGPPRLIRDDDWPNERPFVVLSPQHPGGGCPSAGEIHDFINYALSHYQVDLKRVYLTGLSCGAIGEWGYMGQYADDVQLAAFVPIAGDGHGAWNAQQCDLAKTPIWAFHGDADGTVNISGDNIAMAGLATCPSPPAKEIKYTVYPGVGHNSWARTYDLSAGNDIYTWMLSKVHD